VYSDDYVIEGYGFKIRSPFRYIGSASFQLERLVAQRDYEWVDYGNADFKMSADPGFERKSATKSPHWPAVPKSGVGGEIRAGITSSVPVMPITVARMRIILPESQAPDLFCGPWLEVQ
jgi:hypothetical protein